MASGGRQNVGEAGPERRAGVMEWSGTAGYLALRQIDPALCQSIVRFSEQLAARHNFEPAVSVDVKQALCQFAVDSITRRASLRVLKEAV